MDLVVKGKGGRVSPQTRDRVEQKVRRLVRHEPRVQRVEIQVVEEPSPRVAGGHRVEASARTPRRTFHASARGPNLDLAIEQVISRLDRQLGDHEGRRRAKMIDGANRVKSGRIRSTPAPAPPMKEEE